MDSVERTSSVIEAPPHSDSFINPRLDALSQDSTDPNTESCTNDAACPPAAAPARCANLDFSFKGLHLCNLNVRHLVPKIDELRIVMATEECPDLLGLCETFLDPCVSDGQVALDGYNFIRKDRVEVLNKYGGGLIMYFRESLNVKRRPEIEISNLESIWAEITLPNAKPFLVCSVYRPPDSLSNWIDLFEEELSVAQASGLEIILMGDFNIDYISCTNRKWLNLVQLFDLSQLVSEPTRVTQTSATIIDHVYTTNVENITECFISDFSISDHLPICVTRKINSRVSKSSHITTNYRCFKHFDETMFLNDLENDLITFTANQSTVDEDFAVWHNIIMKHLNNHAPTKNKRVKCKRLPDWFSPEITHMQKRRDNAKKLKQWTDYKMYRNKTIQLIRQAKRKYFSDSVKNSKDSKTIWNHLRAVNNKKKTTLNNLPRELIMNGETITDSEDIAAKLNAYFSSIADILNDHTDQVSTFEDDKLSNFVNSKVPHNSFYYSIDNM